MISDHNEKIGYEHSYAESSDDEDMAYNEKKRKAKTVQIAKKVVNDTLSDRYGRQKINEHSRQSGNSTDCGQFGARPRLTRCASSPASTPKKSKPKGPVRVTSGSINIHHKIDSSHSTNEQEEDTSMSSPIIGTVYLQDDSGIFSDSMEMNNNKGWNINSNHTDSHDSSIHKCTPNFHEHSFSRDKNTLDNMTKHRVSLDSGHSSGGESNWDDDVELSGRACEMRTATEDRWGTRTVPPKKRWLPRSMEYQYHGQVLVTDVTCNCVTVTFLESQTQKGFFKQCPQ